MSGYLLVRVAGRRVGLPVMSVVEVMDGVTAQAVAGTRAEVRGVTMCRGGLRPLVHLGALLDGSAVPEASSGTAVVVRCPDVMVALEVDDADAVVRDVALPVPPGRDFPCTGGIAHHEGELVRILDMEALGARLQTAERTTV